VYPDIPERDTCTLESFIRFEQNITNFIFCWPCTVHFPSCTPGR